MRSPLSPSSPPGAQHPRQETGTLLVGAGHAHLFVLRHGDEFRRRGHALSCVTPDGFWYSGLATGMLGGRYPPALDRVDVARLGDAHGARVTEARVERIDPDARIVTLADGRMLAYDVLSLNVGSIVPELPGERSHPAVFAVKPIERLRDLRVYLTDLFAGTAPATSTAGTPAGKAGRDAVRVVVAGGGATGCEIAANVDALAEKCGGRAAITIVTGSSRLLRQLPARAAADAERFLGRRGIATRCGVRVARIDGRRAAMSDGRFLEFDVLINATGLRPPPLVAASGLAVDEEGALLVDETLRSVSRPDVFGGGDCIAIAGHPLPRIGVYAVRQAPVLHANLLATLAGDRLRPFRPQRRFLAIMNLGDGTALAWRSGLWWRGRGAMWLKDRIDRRFLAGAASAG